MIESITVPRVAILGGAMLILAGLDFCGALLAKEWADRGSRACFLVGLMTFVVLFLVYAASLRTAELSIVTMGWVVLLQVGLILVDRFRFDVAISRDKWLVIIAILLLQAYLILDPYGQTRS